MNPDEELDRQPTPVAPDPELAGEPASTDAAEATEKPATSLRARFRGIRIRVGRVMLCGFALVLGLTLFRGCVGGPSADAQPPAPRSQPPLTSGPDIPHRSSSYAEPADVGPDSAERLEQPARKEKASEDSSGPTSFELSGEQAKAVMELLMQRAADDASIEADRSAELVVGHERTLDMKPGDTAAVRVFPSSQSESYPTILHFADEARVEAMIKADSDVNLQVEHFKNSVTLTLKNPQASGVLHLFGASGQRYRVLYGPGTRDDYDASLTLRMLAAPENASRGPTQAAQLASAMYQRQNPAGVLVYSGRTEKAPAGEVMYEREGLVIRVLWVYEASRLIGYIFEAENIRRSPLLVEQERFKAPGLIMAGTEKHRLEPGETTYLYFIFQRGPDGSETGTGTGSSPFVDNVASH